MNICLSFKAVTIFLMVMISSMYIRPTTHGLFILLDESESRIEEGKVELRAATISLIATLTQQVCPLLVSSSLFYTVYSHPLDNIKGTRNGKALALALGNFRKERANGWVIKQVNRKMYLLLPEKFLKEKKIGLSEVQVQNDYLTDAEKKLGLKVDHMETLSFEQALSSKPSHDGSSFVDYFVQELPHLFVTNKDYSHAEGKDVPLWFIYILGHGRFGKRLAYLSVEEFKKFLDFLEYKVRTKLLYYCSCYAAGQISDSIYGDRKLFSGRTYPFTIISQALTDATVRSHYDFLQKDDNEITLVIYADLVKFLKTAVDRDAIDYKELVSYVTPNLQENGLGSLAQIKIPGVPWFSVVDQEKIVSIGNVLAGTYDPYGFLDISEFSYMRTGNNDPLGILLYTPDVPFELLINSPAKRLALAQGVDPDDYRAPSIISMLPGNAVHHVKKISSDIHTLDEILNSFCDIESLKVEKTFIIDEIEITGVKIYQVLINITPEKVKVYYIIASENEKGEYSDVLYRGIFGLDDGEISVAKMEKCAGAEEDASKNYLQELTEAYELLEKEKREYSDNFNAETKESLLEILKTKGQSFVHQSNEAGVSSK